MVSGEFCVSIYPHTTLAAAIIATIQTATVTVSVSSATNNCSGNVICSNHRLRLCFCDHLVSQPSSLSTDPCLRSVLRPTPPTHIHSSHTHFPPDMDGAFVSGIAASILGGAAAMMGDRCREGTSALGQPAGGVSLSATRSTGRARPSTMLMSAPSCDRPCSIGGTASPRLTTLRTAPVRD